MEPHALRNINKVSHQYDICKVARAAGDIIYAVKKAESLTGLNIDLHRLSYSITVPEEIRSSKFGFKVHNKIKGDLKKGSRHKGIGWRMCPDRNKIQNQDFTLRHGRVDVQLDFIAALKTSGGFSPVKVPR